MIHNPTDCWWCLNATGNESVKSKPGAENSCDVAEGSVEIKDSAPGLTEAEREGK